MRQHTIWSRHRPGGTHRVPLWQVDYSNLLFTDPDFRQYHTGIDVCPQSPGCAIVTPCLPQAVALWSWRWFVSDPSGTLCDGSSTAGYQINPKHFESWERDRDRASNGNLPSMDTWIASGLELCPVCRYRRVPELATWATRVMGSETALSRRTLILK